MIVLLTTNTSVKYWKQERFIVKKSAMDKTHMWSNLSGSYASPLAVYTPQSDGYVYIDVTDYVRTYASTVNMLTFRDENSLTELNIGITVSGLINPEGVIIPGNSLASAGALILPPTMIICAFDNNNLEQAEFYSTTGTWSVTGSASISLDKRKIGQIGGSFTLGDGTHFKTYYPRPMRCGVRYALVKWVSFTGETRAHWFEVEKSKTSTKNAYSLLPLDNEYIEIKGREDGFTLRLNNLDAYDLWYYADVLHSSKVEVSFDGLTYDRVQVTTNSITIPDGEAGTDGRLDINVNWKRYDAVSM